MSEPLTVQMPAEPCVVISDGEVVIVATDRTCEPLRQWGQSVGPVARKITVARLRAFADLLDEEPA